MTAEQVLIEENKKDQRVRYITYDFRSINIWSEKPFYEGVLWKGNSVSWIKTIDIVLDFGEKNIFCIDDIKIPPIPDKWYIECTEGNIDILDRWRLKNAKEYLDWQLRIGHIVLSKNLNDNSLFHLNYDRCFPDDNYKDYQKITLEQFKKYVLGEEKEEEKQEENSSSHSTGSYVKSGSIGSVGFSGKYVKTGRIVSVDLNLNPFENQNNDNTFEFYSTKCWIEDRINYINQFIKINIDSDFCINPDWISERNELIEKLKNL